MAIRDIQELHHVGTVLALPLQRARDLLADRRPVVGKRHQPRLPAVILQTIAQQFGLRLLAALIQPFEYDQVSHVPTVTAERVKFAESSTEQFSAFSAALAVIDVICSPTLPSPACRPPSAGGG